MSENKSLPSKLIYSIDVPEVTSLKAEFIYNYYTPDEVVNDSNILNQDIAKKMNISQNVLLQVGSLQLSEDVLKSKILLQKIPRYVKISYSFPNQINVSSSTLFANIKNNVKKIVSEDTFSTSYYTSINVSNGNIDNQVSSLFDNINSNKNEISFYNSFPKSVENSFINFDSANTKVIGEVTSLQMQQKGVFFKNKIASQYFEKIKTTKFYSQINNNILYDLFIRASSSYHLNNNSYASQLDFANKVKKVNDNFNLSDDEFKPTIPFYKKEIGETDSKITPIGYLIEKTEIFSDQTIKTFEPIVIENPSITNYVDLNVRYGATYVYQVKAIFNLSYSAVDNSDLDFFKVNSLISSKSVICYVETIENVAPPPPVDFKVVWDYDRYNPTTQLIDHSTGKNFSNTGTRGSLMLLWTLPVNSQMDIKKIQIFRRKTANDPFELIKMFDFNDSIVKFQDLDDMILKNIIETTTPDPGLSFYDDDFKKTSEYIYALASIDAHGLTSNYSEQFNVKFDSYSNKIVTTLVSIAGAPKQYPNLYLEKDLFVDTIKSSKKNLMHVYLTPKCYKIKNDDDESNVLVYSSLSNTSDVSKYVMNFINIDNQKSSNLEIKIFDKTSKGI